MTTVAPQRAQQRGVARADRRRSAGRSHRRRHRRAVAGRRAHRHRVAQPGAGDHLRSAVRAGGGGDRRRAGGGVVPVRGVSGAAADQRRARRRRLPRAATRHGRVGRVDGVCGAARAVDRVRRLGAAAARTPQSGQRLVGGQPRRHRRRLALDRVHRGRGHAGQPSGAALVVDAGAARRCADHARAAGADRSFVGRRRARSGHQQPAHPPHRGRAVGGRAAGTAGPRDAFGGARGPRGPAVLGAGAVVLRGDGRQRCGQRAGADPAARARALRIRVVGDRQVRRAVCARRHRVAPASQRARGAEDRSGSPRAADPAGAGRGGRLRSDVRHRGRIGPHTAAAAADRTESRRGRDRLRLRRAADRRAGVVRLAVRPHLRHCRDRHGGAVSARSAPAAPSR